MIGIDVAKDTLAVCWWPAGASAPKWERSYANSKAGLRRLLKDTPPEEPWVLEPTGPYSLGVVEAALEAGRKPRQADPYAAKRYLESHTSRVKSDRIDARGLARLGLDRELPAYRLKDPDLQRLWELLLVRRGLTKARATLQQQRHVLAQVQSAIAQAMASLGQQIQSLDREIKAEGRKLELFRRLLKVPGLGPINAAALTVRLSSIPFATDHAFVAYVGLDVRLRESGKYRGRRRLTKQGDAVLRWLLYLAARATLRSKKDLRFKQLYQRKRAEGCTSTGALCILARKLARLAWALAHSGKEYDPTRVFAQRPA
jgi:transposase